MPVKSVEMMEHIKSKIELFDNVKQSKLLPAIIQKYAELLSIENMMSNDMIMVVLKKFEEQITQNQNGIFLNLTNCTNELWEACVYCVNQIEKQNTNLEMLDKERENEMEKIRNVINND